MLRMARGSRLSWPALVVAAFCLVTPEAARAACDGRPVPAGVQTIETGGLRRTFVVRAPSEADARGKAPVVIAFHPFGTGANYMVTRVPIGRFWPSALVLYPDGMPRDISSPVPSWQNRAGELGDRDLTFFDAMVEWAEKNACIDRTRVFVLGYSNGAGLAYLLGCERSAAVAGVAVTAGRMSCRPSAAKPVMANHGTFDNTIPYEQAIEATKAWATANGCAAPPRAGTLGCTEAQSCASAPLSLCSYRGGHEYDVSFTRTAAEFLKAVKP